MELEIRKFVTYSENVHIEGFKKTDKPLHIFAVAAVITNPWAGKFVEGCRGRVSNCFFSLICKSKCLKKHFENN